MLPMVNRGRASSGHGYRSTNPLLHQYLRRIVKGLRLSHSQEFSLAQNAIYVWAQRSSSNLYGWILGRHAFFIGWNFFGLYLLVPF